MSDNGGDDEDLPEDLQKRRRTLSDIDAVDGVDESDETGQSSGGGRDDVQEASDDAVDGDDDDAGVDGGPAFAFDDTATRSVYPEEPTKALYDAARMDVRSLLIRDHGYEEVPQREIDDAVLRLADERPELVAELVRERRGDLDNQE